jgi:hypothetical protein
MAFGVHLSTSKFYPAGPTPVFDLRLTEPVEEDVPFRNIFVEARGILASVTLGFPQPGSIEYGRVGEPTFREIDPTPRPVGVWGRLIEPKTGNRTNFRISPVGSNDSLVLFAINPNSFTGSMFHRTEGLQMAPCVVSCADGKTAHPCVTCKSGHVEIRICC